MRTLAMLGLLALLLQGCTQTVVIGEGREADAGPDAAEASAPDAPDAAPSYCIAAGCEAAMGAYCSDAPDRTVVATVCWYQSADGANTFACDCADLDAPNGCVERFMAWCAAQ